MSTKRKNLNKDDTIIVPGGQPRREYAGELTAILTNKECLTAEQCQWVIDKYRDKVEPAKVMSDGEGIVDTEYRVCEMAYMLPDEDDQTMDIIDTLLQMTLQANARYQFDVDAFESISIVRYPEGGFYSWHKDLGSKHTAYRKISMSVQLSAPEDYEGGDLHIDLHSKIFSAPRDQGSITLFPSFERHQVTPVTRGERWAIVAFSAGAYRFR